MSFSLYSDNSRKIKKIIAICAGKGGVGKSTLTVGLAHTFSQMGLTVGLLDADIYGPSICKMLPEGTAPSENGDKILPGRSGQIRTISMGHFREEKNPCSFRAPIANKIIGQFLDRVEWGSLDVLLVDFPPGTGDIQLTLLQRSFFTGGIIVTTPQEIALLDVRKSLELLRSLEVPILGVVENMSYYIAKGKSEKEYLFGRGGGRALAEEYAVPFLGEIPIDPPLGRALDQGEPIENFESLKNFSEIAEVFFSQINSDSKIPLEISLPNPQTLLLNGKKIPIHTIQKNCPCVRCANIELNEESLHSIGANRMERIGNYAIRFTFTSGCSRGIYPLRFIQGLIG